MLLKHLRATPDSKDSVISAVDVLESENRALKAGLKEATTDGVGSAAGSAKGSGVDESQLPSAEVWTPNVAPVDGGFIEEYGPNTPIPDHNGTDVFKWDDTLWSHDGHFKVCPLHT